MNQVFGIPVSGTPHLSTHSYIPQRPLEDLRQVFLDLINDPNVIEFGWRQYTPYFNDGDVCVFSVYDPWIRTVDDAEDLSGYDLEIGDTHPTLGNHSFVRYDKTPEEIEAERKRKMANGWSPNVYIATYDYRDEPREAKYPETQTRAERLLDITSGAFDEALLGAFGDHAQITVTETGITIDEYSHD